MKRPALKIKRISSLIILFWLLGLIWIRCSKNDDQGLIRENLSLAIKAAEKKDRAKVLQVLDPDYLDFENRDVKATAELLDYYFKHYHGIVIHLLEAEIIVNQDTAEVRADILFSSGPLETLRKSLGLIGSFYRFEFRMSRGAKGWKIKQAKWHEVEENSLLPGSRMILKKLFPDLF